MSFVQVFPADTRASDLGRALGSGLGQLLNRFGAEKALSGVLNDPNLQNAPFHQRMGALNQALARYGDLGKQMLSNQLLAEKGRQQEYESGILARALFGNQQPTPEEFSRLSPQSQLKLFGQRQSQDVNLLSNQAFSRGYRAILDDDLETLKNVIEDPETPVNVKHQLANIRNQQSVRADVRKGEIRRRQDMVQRAYARAIADERAKIKQFEYRKQIPEIEERIKNLEKMRQKDIKKLISDPESYNALSIWGSEASSFIPNESEGEAIFPGSEEVSWMSEDQQEPAPTQVQREPSQKPKMKFNPKNPAHVQKAKQALQRAGNDRAKANAMLAEEFSL